MKKIEYTSFTYDWRGQGWTQEISCLRNQNKEELHEWKHKYWTDFLNFMAQEQWDLVTVAPLGGGNTGIYGIAAYFKRQVQ